ncbi:MAG: PilZ domain-containing protein [Acidobacteriota bacterium]
MIHAHRLLAVGFSADEFQTLSADFDPSWDVDCLPSGAGALDLLRLCRLDLVVVRYPLPGITLESFLHTLRSRVAESHATSLVLVTERTQAPEACRFIGKGANRVLSLERAPELLAPTVRALLRIAPRKPVQFGARLEMPRLGSFLGVVRNSSRTGLLIETGQKPPRGTELRFELDLPTGGQVLGRAKVVRHTEPVREGVVGLGMRITAFAGRDAGRRYSAFVEA